MKDILDVNVLEDLNNIINFNNIKLLEKPQIKENTTILKIGNCSYTLYPINRCSPVR